MWRTFQGSELETGGRALPTAVVADVVATSDGCIVGVVASRQTWKVRQRWWDHVLAFVRDASDRLYPTVARDESESKPEVTGVRHSSGLSTD